MPFNSNHNNINSSFSPDESFHEMQNSYTLSREGFTNIPQQQLFYQERKIPPKYINPGFVHSSVSYYNGDELRQLNNYKHKNNDSEKMEGAGVGKFLKKSSRNVGSAIKKSTIDKDGLIHKVISKVADKAIPMAGEAIGAAVSTYFTGDPEIGAKIGKQAGEMGRKELDKKTGYGTPGIGKYKKDVKLDMLLTKYVPNYKTQVHNKKDDDFKIKINKPKKAISSRNLIVAKIMKEHNLSLPDASKYVKKHNLY